SSGGWKPSRRTPSCCACAASTSGCSTRPASPAPVPRPPRSSANATATRSNVSGTTSSASRNASMLKLHFKDSRQAPVWLVEERFTLGRDRRNDLVLEDPGISAFHAEIRQEGGLYYISDCESEQGTFVNDERVASRYQLRSDDRVRLGDVELLLVDPGKAGARAEVGQRWFLQVIQGEHE